MNHNENIKEAVLSVPPVSVAGLTLMNVSLSDWVLIASLTWIVLQIGWFGVSRWSEYKAKKEKKL